MAGMPFSFAALLDRSDIWRGDSLNRAGTPTVACGFPELDAELPGGGWPAGALTEILPAHEGIGELRLPWTRACRIVPTRIAARLDRAASPALRSGARRGGNRTCEPCRCARRLAERNALGHRTGARFECLRRGARLASRREIRGAEAPANRCRRRPRPRFSVPGPGGRRRILPGGAADSARHERRRPCGTACSSVEALPLAQPILLPAMPPAVRSKNHHVDRHPAAPGCRSRFFCAARPRLNLSRSKSGTAFSPATARPSHAAFAPAWPWRRRSLSLRGCALRRAIPLRKPKRCSAWPDGRRNSHRAWHSNFPTACCSRSPGSLKLFGGLESLLERLRGSW